MVTRTEYSISIDVMEDGSIEVQLAGEKPIDLMDSRNWTPAQQTAAGIYINLGIPQNALEMREDIGPEQ